MATLAKSKKRCAGFSVRFIRERVAEGAFVWGQLDSLGVTLFVSSGSPVQFPCARSFSEVLPVCVRSDSGLFCLRGLLWRQEAQRQVRPPRGSALGPSALHKVGAS